MRRHVFQLRSRRCYGILYKAFRGCTTRADARVVQFSIQHDHVHMMVEAADARALARAVQGMAIRMAKGLNKLMGRTGQGAVFADRYHARSLRTPTEVRHVLVYVLCNGRKHDRFGKGFTAGWIDPYSSGPWFTGWTVRVPPPNRAPPVSPATVWLLTKGWRERAGGPLRPDEMPPGGHDRAPMTERQHLA